MILIGRNATKINNVVSAFKSQGGADRIRGYYGDVSNKGMIDDLISSLERKGITIDILVNNAAIITPITRIADSSPEEWLEAQKINLFGSFLCARAVIPWMLRKGRGTIINISSGVPTILWKGGVPIVLLRLASIFLLNVFMKNMVLLEFGYLVIVLEWSILQCRRSSVTLRLIRSVR